MKNQITIKQGPNEFHFEQSEILAVVLQEVPEKASPQMKEQMMNANVVLSIVMKKSFAPMILPYITLEAGTADYEKISKGLHRIRQPKASFAFDRSQVAIVMYQIIPENMAGEQAETKAALKVVLKGNAHPYVIGYAIEESAKQDMKKLLENH